TRGLLHVPFVARAQSKDRVDLAGYSFAHQSILVLLVDELAENQPYRCLSGVVAICDQERNPAHTRKRVAYSARKLNAEKFRHHSRICTSCPLHVDLGAENRDPPPAGGIG